jgi:antitoxin (DNA-binding transcriptional repressor) of toxin-antitoxin stability system
MSQVSIAEAKNALTRLIHAAERGEAIHITRHGKPVTFASPSPRCMHGSRAMQFSLLPPFRKGGNGADALKTK